MVCLRNICINTLHKGNDDDDGDNDDDNDNDNDNNNNNNNNKLIKDKLLASCSDRAIEYQRDIIS
jgi:hypothetical protein